MGGSMFVSAPGRRATLDQLADAGFTETETVTATDPLGSDSEFVFATLADDSTHYSPNSSAVLTCIPTNCHSRSPPVASRAPLQRVSYS